MAKKVPKDRTLASFSELLGPGGIQGFLNPTDPAVKKSRERAAKLVEKEFLKLLAPIFAEREQKKRQKLLRKLASSGESP